MTNQGGTEEENFVFKMPSTSPSLQRHSESKTSSPDAIPETPLSPMRAAGYISAYECDSPCLEPIKFYSVIQGKETVPRAGWGHDGEEERFTGSRPRRCSTC